MGVSRSLWDYRAFIQSSKAEFGVAKHTYVATRSGWFSDRTECYLASGRPALVQDTGWTAHLPHGEGLLAFSNPDEALAGIDRINSDYERHARRAVEIAREHFDARRVLPRLLDEALRMSAPLRIAHVAPVATSIPPPKSGSVESMTSLLTEGLVARGHDVTLFATADSKTSARLVSIYEHGYWHDPNMWPWELYEMLNLAAAVERAGEFDIIHYEAGVLPDVARLHAPVADADRTDAAPFAERRRSRRCGRAIRRRRSSPSRTSRPSCSSGANVVATVLHGIDTHNFTFRDTPDDYLLFLGRFTEGKGVLQAIEVARRAGMRLMLAAAENDYYRERDRAARRRRHRSSTTARPTSRPR